jgi:hypothetical protein
MIEVGDRVRYTADWLRSTGQVVGEAGFMRGRVADFVPLASCTLAVVHWDHIEESRVLVQNLEKCR